MSAADAALSRMVARFAADGAPRVWSLVVTVLGDVAEPHGGWIHSARLREMLAALGIEAGAVRAAVSRLKADGWIDSERDGRGSRYSFSETARDEYEEVEHRVYAARQATDEWCVVAGPEPPHFDAVPLGVDVWLAPGRAEEWEFSHPLLTVQGRLAMNGTLVLPAEHRHAMTAVQADAADAAAMADAAPVDAMTGRLLLIHRWRRYVLRFPDLMPPLIRSDPRVAVAAAYRPLKAASRAWLTCDAHGMDAMPPADGAPRFI